MSPTVTFYTSKKDYAHVETFQEKHGKEWGRLITDFIKDDLSDCRDNVAKTEELFNRAFGDIESEKYFEELCDGNEQRVSEAINNRLQAVYEQHKALYPKVLEMFIKCYPKLAKIAKLVGAS